MRIALYARVSTTRQAQAQTTEQQLTRLRDYITHQGWILDALGGLHSFGRDGGVAPPPYPYWSTPVAVDLAEY